jgi:Mrp family chromosome partitioning ATPase
LDNAGIWFLPAGSPPENPFELIQSRRLADLLNQVAARYDWILIDSPPILPLADTTVWSRLAEGVLLVTREGKTHKDALKRGLEALNKSNLVGVVLNGSTGVDQSGYYQKYGTSPSLDSDASSRS